MQLMVWTAWTEPDNVQQSDIPKAAGVYELMSVDTTGKPIQFIAVSPLPSDIQQSDVEALQGVLYIGKADDLTDRYWKFVQSWQTNAIVDAHGCRTQKYDSDAQIRCKYPLSSLRVRCMPIVEHSDLDSESEKVRKALIPGDVRRRTPNEELLANLGMSTNPRNDYASYEEGKLLHRFVACFDQKPEMNKNKGEQESPKPDDAFLKNLFGDEWEEE